MEGRRRHREVGYWLWLLLMCVRLDLGASINDEVRALSSFKEKVELDPYGALSGWNEEAAADPCFWFGIRCGGGRVVSLNLQNLGLRGTLAPELGNLTHLKSLILHNNSFFGFIPREIARLPNLEVLNLGHNNFSSPVPSDLRCLLSLKNLSNKFIHRRSPQLNEINLLPKHQFGEELMHSDRLPIKRNYGGLTTRRSLLVASQENGKKQRIVSGTSKLVQSPELASSHRKKHHKHGEIRAIVLGPSYHSASSIPVHTPALAPFPTASSSSTSISSSPVKHLHAPGPSPALAVKPISLVPGNKPNSPAKPQSSVALTSHNESPPPTDATNTNARHVTSAKICIAIGVVSFLLVASAACIICWRAHKVVTIKPWATGLSGQLQKAFLTGVPALKRSELQAACEDFSNIIGSQSDCILYKGILSSGVEIAVISTVAKSVKDWPKQSESAFKMKVSTLSKVNHRNFVNLLGYCAEEEHFTRMMVFEYAPNGTLFEHLHVREAEQLDWGTRLRIAMGIAYCLDYMNQLNPPVLLKTLDSSTIYLTDDYAAKVSDLQFQTEPKDTKSLPEASDRETIVYRFGMLLLEILSGKLPFSEEDGLLEHWASSYLNGERPLKELIDPTLTTFNKESLAALCKVISSCIHPEPTERPRMQEIVNWLREITSMPPEGATPKVSPLWWAELEIISSEAN